MKPIKIWTWDMLLHAVHSGRIFEALDSVGRRLRPLMALGLSCAKWSVDNRCGLFHGDREDLYDDSCGLCMYWSEVAEKRNKRNKDKDPIDGCDICPIGRSGKGCNNNGSIWWKALEAHIDRQVEPFNEAADALLAKLNDLYTAEYYRLWPKE